MTESSQNSPNHSLGSDLKRMAPVWVIVTITALGTLFAIRASGKSYLEAGIVGAADACAVAEVRYNAAEKIRRKLAADAMEAADATPEGRSPSTLGKFENDERLLKAQEHLNEAIELCGNVPEAFLLLSDLAWWSGDEAAAYYHQGQEAATRGDFVNARIEFQIAYEKQPENSAYLLSLIEALSQEARWNDLDQLMASAPESITNSPESLRARARSAEFKADFSGAVDLLEQVLEKEPGHPQTVEDLTRLYVITETGGDGARLLLSSLREATYPTAQSYDRVSRLFQSEGLYEEALEASSEALRISRNNAYLYFSHALILSELGLDGEARASMQRALDINPNEYIGLIKDSYFESLRTLDIRSSQ